MKRKRAYRKMHLEIFLYQIRYKKRIKLYGSKNEMETNKRIPIPSEKELTGASKDVNKEAQE